MKYELTLFMNNNEYNYYSIGFSAEEEVKNFIVTLSTLRNRFLKVNNNYINIDHISSIEVIELKKGK